MSNMTDNKKWLVPTYGRGLAKRQVYLFPIWAVAETFEIQIKL